MQTQNLRAHLPINAMKKQRGGNMKKMMYAMVILLMFVSVGSITPKYRIREISICTESGTQLQPAISGSIVVWQDNRRGNFDIYGYDLSTRRHHVICAAPGDQVRPVISGNIVVWEDKRNGNLDIYGYDLSKRRTFEICTESEDQWEIAISGNIVVWTDKRNGNWDIYGYDLYKEKEFAICKDPKSQTWPAI
jgi:TolB protein